MLNVERITPLQPNLILPDGIRWLYIARTTTPVTLRTSEGGNIVAIFGRNSSGDIMVPEEFTALHFEFHFSDADQDPIRARAYLIIYYSDAPLRVNRNGLTYYPPENSLPITDIDIPREHMGYPYDELNYVSLASQVTGIHTLDPVAGTSTVKPIQAASGGADGSDTYLACATVNRRARTFYTHNSQGSFPYAMQAVFAGADRYPIFEMDFSFVDSMEVFIDSLTVDIVDASAAISTSVDLMYEPPGYAFNGSANADTSEIGDIPSYSIANPWYDLIPSFTHRRSVDPSSTAPDTNGYILARRVIIPTAVTDLEKRIELVERRTNITGRESPVQPILHRESFATHPKLCVVLQTSGVVTFRVFVECTFTVVDKLNSEGGNIWI
jgi:hypothetical protein